MLVGSNFSVKKVDKSKKDMQKGTSEATQNSFRDLLEEEAHMDS